MAQKDDFKLQSQRVVDAVRKMCSRCTVTFDPNEAPRRLRFRVEDGSITLTKAYPHYHVSEVADWTDEQLQQMIETLTGGLVRKSA
jgi:hypothetical protein